VHEEEKQLFEPLIRFNETLLGRDKKLTTATAGKQQLLPPLNSF